MNQNYQFNFNPEEPSKESIQKHMDFEGLLARYQKEEPVKKPPLFVRYKNIIYLGTAIAAILAGVVFLLRPYLQLSPSVDEATYFAERAFIEPPYATAQAQFASRTVNVNEGGIYEFENGSRLVVPSAAFADDRGNLIAGEVKIHYREFHDPVDFFLSGIPMYYDSLDTRYNLESAGMMEIYAEQNGKRVKMAAGKSIDVELVSAINVPNINIPPKFNIYKLDTVARNWVYQEIDNIQLLHDDLTKQSDPLFDVKKAFVDQVASLEAQRIAELEALEAQYPKPIEPVAPIVHNGDNPTLELDFQGDNFTFEGENQEALYTGTIWQISPDNPTYNENALKVAWEKVQLRSIDAYEYILTLINGNNQFELIVNPVLTGTAYQDALKEYEVAMEAYTIDLKAWEQAIAAQSESLHQQTDVAIAALQQSFDQQLQQLKEEGIYKAPHQAYIKRKVINRFRATSFGIWNCDRPIPPMEQEVAGRFKDQFGNYYNKNEAYLVDKSRNTIYRFLATNGAKVRFNVRSENVLWLVTEEGKIAVFKPEDFQQIKPTTNNFTFELELLDQKMEKASNLRATLEL